MKTIAWDVDDTLNDLMRSWLETWHKPRHRSCRVAYAAIAENPPHKALGLSLRAYQDSYDAFRLSGRYDELPPEPQALAWFRRNGGRYRHIAVTAVPLLAAHKSAAWVFRHFGRWIRTFHVVPSPRPLPRAPRYDADKAGFLRSIGGCNYFVDDAPAHIAAVGKTGARCLLVPRPWNGQTGSLASLLGEIK